MAARWSLLVLVFLMVVCAGCRSKSQINVEDPYNDRVMIMDVGITAANFNDGEHATLSVNWLYGMGTFTVKVGIGTQVNPTLTTWEDTTTEHSYSSDFILEEGSFYYTIVVTSEYGGIDTESGFFTTVGPPLNDAPEIAGAVFDETTGRLTVTVTDAEGDDVEVSVTPITGMSVDQETQTVTGGNGTAEFYWSPDSWYFGGSGATTVTVASDASVPEQENTQDVDIIFPPAEFGLAQGELGVIPLSTSTTVGEQVTVVVACGDFPTDAPFAFMNGVAVTVTDGGDYVAGSFNVGEVGGDRRDTDGIWAQMDPAPEAYFVPEDFMMAALEVKADTSLDFMGFNITPINGGEITDGGVLFNFGMEFDSAGTYELGILEFQDVKRTYYSDSDDVEYNWSDIENSLDVPVAITVN